MNLFPYSLFLLFLLSLSACIDSFDEPIALSEDPIYVIMGVGVLDDKTKELTIFIQVFNLMDKIEQSTSNQWEPDKFVPGLNVKVEGPDSSYKLEETWNGYRLIIKQPQMGNYTLTASNEKPLVEVNFNVVEFVSAGEFQEIDSAGFTTDLSYYGKVLHDSIVITYASRPGNLYSRLYKPTSSQWSEEYWLHFQRQPNRDKLFSYSTTLGVNIIRQRDPNPEELDEFFEDVLENQTTILYFATSEKTYHWAKTRHEYANNYLNPFRTEQNFQSMEKNDSVIIDFHYYQNLR